MMTSGDASARLTGLPPAMMEFTSQGSEKATRVMSHVYFGRGHHKLFSIAIVGDPYGRNLGAGANTVAGLRASRFATIEVATYNRRARVVRYLREVELRSREETQTSRSALGSEVAASLAGATSWESISAAIRAVAGRCAEPEGYGAFSEWVAIHAQSLVSQAHPGIVAAIEVAYEIPHAALSTLIQMVLDPEVGGLRPGNEIASRDRIAATAIQRARGVFATTTLSREIVCQTAQSWIKSWLAHANDARAALFCSCAVPSLPALCGPIVATRFLLKLLVRPGDQVWLLHATGLALAEVGRGCTITVEELAREDRTLSRIFDAVSRRLGKLQNGRDTALGIDAKATLILALGMSARAARLKTLSVHLSNAFERPSGIEDAAAVGVGKHLVKLAGGELILMDLADGFGGVHSERFSRFRDAVLRP